ncbi:SAM-dependent methyltransferase TehB [Neisseriaceae bacterium PsAf]|nr:SAM-dependent methyltransferase TehB [Neisseriaceae bacterium PsAf]MCV2503397.1 SAM-dependent methyltransferase TehB [Neisseriaceae bacterium]
MYKELVRYKTLPKWDAQSLPQAFCKKHNTQQDTWAKLEIMQGELDFEIMNEAGNVISTHHFSKKVQPPFIEPQVWHRIAKVSDDLNCQLSFYCRQEDFAKKKYNFSRAHSEVIEAFENITFKEQPNHYKVLDLGCGQGRNSIYLTLKGFNVTGVDIEESKIKQLQNIITENQLNHLHVYTYNINAASIEEQYDFILSTVVFMMLDSKKVPEIIRNMQNHTNKNGYNLIVSVMNTDDYPCDLDFKHKFKTNELKNYYQDWEIIKYNEDVGEMHKLDPQGNRYKFRFATLLAKKIE